MPRATLGARVLLALAVLAAAFMAVDALGLGSARVDGLAWNCAYNAAIAAGALMCLLRAHSLRHERGAWTSLGLGLAAWSAAEIFWSLAYGSAGNPSSPNPADAGYLLYYPLAYLGLGLLIRARVREFRASQWLDGIVQGLVVSALAAALFAGPVFANGSAGDPVTVAFNFAYPVLDLLLLGFAVAAFALCGWRPGRGWFLLGAGLAVGALADVLYLHQVAVGAGGNLPDVLWPASVTLIGAAAWQPSGSAAAPVEGWLLAGVPAVAAALAGGLLLVADSVELPAPAVILAAAGLAAAIVRMGLTIAENARMLAASRREALTDGLTGLGNRRKLMGDLRHELRCARERGEGRVLALFDLDGFKQYNDSFGHPAGDILLARLGARLAEAVRRSGAAYRMGGDEFCALVRAPRGADAALAVQVAARALSEHGEGFAVGSSFGTVSLPTEAHDAIEALQLADRRMYGQKDRRRSSARRQARDVLLQVLDEREPQLAEHLREVADLAVAVAARLELSDQAVEEVFRAAELHDVGKMAVPDAILEKPGPLDPDEWDFVRQHTLIGERILAAAPSLGGAAQLVRASHERWDGGGYPDGLAAEAIPLGARIIAVCDAYEAMISVRPYRDALSSEAAVHELHRGAGSQFDPEVVNTLEQELRARSYGSGRTRSSPRRSRRRPRASDASSAVAESAM